MAARVNTRLLLILFVVTCTAGLLIGAVWFFQSRQDATRYAAAAEEAIAEGRPLDALNHWRRAVGRDNTNLEYMERWEETLGMIQPATSNQADELYRGLIGVYKHRADHRPMETDHHVRMLEELHMAARLSQLAPWYRTLMVAAEEMEQRVPPGQPKREYAKLYRGLVLTSEAMRNALTEEEVEEGVEEILAFREIHPDDDKARAELLSYYLRQSQEYRAFGQTTRAAELLADAKAEFEKAMENDTIGPETLLVALEYLDDQDERNPELNQPDIARDIAERLVIAAADQDDPWVVAEAATVLGRLSWVPNSPEQVELLDRAIERRPDRIDYRILKARWHYIKGEYDEADAAADSVINAEPPPVSFLAMYRPEIRRRAAGTKVDIALRRWEAASEAERPELLAAIEAAAAEVIAIVGDLEDNPQAKLARAKVAYAKRDYATAAGLFDELASDAALRKDIELLQFAAVCLEREGSVGRALGYVDDALDVQPKHMNARLQRARLLARLRRWREATSEIEMIKAMLRDLQAKDPGNPELQGYIETVARVGDVIVARETISDVDTNQPSRALLSEAQKAIANDDIDGARAMIVAALRDRPNDLMLVNGLIRTELAAGNDEEARRLVDRALELAPNNPVFTGMRVTLDEEDPIERIHAYTEVMFETGPERLIEKLTAMDRLERQETARAKQAEEAGAAETAAEIRDIAARARTEKLELLARAEAEMPTHAGFIEYRFVRAILDDDLTEAAAVVEVAKETDADRAGGAMYEGRLATANGDYEAAVDAFERAVAQLDYSATAWKLLAITYQQSGRLREAIEAYEQAYRNNPNDLITLRAYAALLSQSGDAQRALALLREGRTIDVQNVGLRAQWLDLETRLGELGFVLRERRRVLRRDVRDLANAAALVSLLSDHMPARETLLDGDGGERYSFDRWSRISDEEKARVLRAEREAWDTEIDMILDGMQKPEDRGLRWYQLKAQSLFARGRAAEGEVLLREFVESQETDPERVGALIALADFYASTNQRDRSEAALREALPIQADDLRRADHVLAGVLFESGRYDEAMGHFERVAEVRPSRDVEMQIAETLLRNGDLDAASKRLAGAVAEYGEDSRCVLLRASIVSAGIDKKWAEGKRDEVRPAYESLLEAFDQAAEMSPAEPMPYVLRARAMLAQYRRTQSAVILDDALASLAQADRIRSGFPPTALTRVSIMREMGNNQGVITELQGLLESSPAQNEARASLMRALLAEGRVDEAIAVNVAGVRQNPSSPDWPEQLGDLFRQFKQDSSGAIEHYETALAIRPTRRLLVKLCDSYLRELPPRYEEVLAFSKKHPEPFTTSPVLRGNLARATALDGDRDRALEMLAEAHDLYIQEIEAGDREEMSLMAWYADLRALFPLDAAADAEAFVFEVTDGAPGPVDYRMLATSIWMATGKDGMSRSVELLEIAAVECPEDNTRLLAEIYGDLGVYHLIAKDDPAALEALKKVLTIDPDNPVALNNIAHVLGDRMGEPREALPYAKRAVELRPSDWAALDTLGWIYAQIEDWTEAESWLRRSVGLEGRADNNYHLAFVLAKIGEPDRALRRLQRAAEMSPDPDTLAKINQLADDIRTGGTDAR